MRRVLLILVCFVFSSIGYAKPPSAQVSHVILISFDGLRPDAITGLGQDKAAAFYRMIKEGASTLNARTDDDFTVTLPNHACMMTGYPVEGVDGHHLTENALMDKTIHDFAGRHVYSVFDVLHDHGRHSAMLASKLKFNIYKESFPIDLVFLTNLDDLKTAENFKKIINEGLPDFVFMHFAGADRVGHQRGWDIKQGSPYMKEVQVLDGYLKEVLKEISSHQKLRDSTVVIVTADHGGEGMGHSNKNNPRDFTIPLIIWGKPVAKGVDLYRINTDRRRDPSDNRVSYREKWQPIRNGDAANLSLSLLRLPPVQGSTIGYKESLKINEGSN